MGAGCWVLRRHGRTAAHALSRFSALPALTTVSGTEHAWHTKKLALCNTPQATVFAVYDEAKILQYVGFSKGLRDSLRTLFSRRPDKAHYYRQVAAGGHSWAC